MKKTSNSKLITTLLALLMTMFINKTLQAKETAFSAIEFEQLKQQHLGKKWLMLLWSVDCPPCFKELKLINKMNQQYDDLAIIIVNTDEQVDASERQKIIDEHQLQGFQHFYFEDGQTAHNRFVIDPSWYGELPRSYFVDVSGKFYGKSGLIAEELLSKWLVPSKAKILISQQGSINESEKSVNP